MRNRAFPLWAASFTMFIALLIASYTSFPLIFRASLTIIGFIIPILLLCRPRSAFLFPPQLESMQERYFWAGLGALWITAIFVRFIYLSSFNGWPTPDEGFYAFLASEVSAGEPLHIWYGYQAGAPFYPLLFGLFLKIVHPSLTSLWLLPTLLSFCTLPLLLIASKWLKLPKLLVLAFSFSFSLTFWPVWTARGTASENILLVMEILCLCFWGAFLQAKNPVARLSFAMILGTLVGLGLYTYQPWPSVVVLFTIFVFYAALRDSGKKNRVIIMAYSFPLMIISLPFIIALTGRDLPSRYLHDFVFKCDLNPLRCITQMAWVPSFIFIGSTRQTFIFGPVFGGLLNPVFGTFWGIGLAFLWHHRKNALSLALFAAYTLLFWPGLLSNEGNIHRVTAAMPWVLMTVSLGALTFIRRCRTGFSWILLALLISVGVGFDTIHMIHYHKIFGIPGHHWPLYKSAERYRAYQAIRTRFGQEGPGWILIDFPRYVTDRTLAFAAIPYQAKPSVSASWCAVMANIHYRPFLEERFPAIECIPLAVDLTPPDGGLALFILPIRKENRSQVEHWKTAHDSLRPYIHQMMHQRLWDKQEPMLRTLFSLKRSFEGDPFLSSLFWEKVIYHYDSDDHLYGALWAARKAIEWGYPAAHLLNELGVLCYRSGDLNSARSAFKKALQAPLNLMPADENLRRLETGH